MEQSKCYSMEEKIKEVQDYFKNKILSGEFDIKIHDQYTCELLIDSKYKFTIWVANGPEYRKIYHSPSNFSFMDLKFTDEESMDLDKLISPIVSKYTKEVLIEEKKKELEKLIEQKKKELEKLQSEIQ